MTVTNETTRKKYDGDDVTVSFPTTFPFFEETDLVVIERVKATGAESTKVLGVDYTVTITSPSDLPSLGTVVATAAPASTVEWHILRSTKATQETDYVNSAAFQAETTEADLDRAALRDMDRARDVERSLKFPRTDDEALDPEIPDSATRASKYLGFDSGGEPVALDAPAGTTTLSAFGAAFVVLADAAAARANLLVERIAADTIGNQPLASSFGAGLFYATDVDQLYYSDGSSWSLPIGPGQFAQASLPAAAAAGRLYLDTDNLLLKRDNGGALEDVRAPLPRGWISGLGLSLAGSNQDVRISSGECRARSAGVTSLMNAYLTTLLTKRCDATWAPDDGAGGRAEGTSNGAGQWWHVFLLVHPDGSVDAGIDTSVVGVNLLSDTAVVAAGFTRHRRIGSIKETGAGDGTMVDFIQHGDYFIWETIRDRDFVSTSLDSSQQDISLDDVPPGVKVLANISLRANNLTSVGLLASGGVTISGVPQLAGDPLGNISAAEVAETWVMTDVSQQIRYRGDDATNDLHVSVLGWMDYRGRFD